LLYSKAALNIAAPEYEDGNDLCQGAGDIWLIGDLMYDTRIPFNLSDRAENFRNRLTCQNPDKRLSADKALNDNWFDVWYQ